MEAAILNIDRILRLKGFKPVDRYGNTEDILHVVKVFKVAKSLNRFISHNSSIELDYVNMSCIRFKVKINSSYLKVEVISNWKPTMKLLEEMNFELRNSKLRQISWYRATGPECGAKKLKDKQPKWRQWICSQLAFYRKEFESSTLEKVLLS